MKKAFTLIELLVVIAIIAMLLAVIVPALKKAKEHARNLQCRVNVRSMALALRTYGEETEGEIFDYMSGLFLNQLAPYIGDVDETRYCPNVKVSSEVEVDQRIADNEEWGASRITWIWTGGVAEPEQGAYGFSGWLYGYPESTRNSWEFVGIEEVETMAWHNILKIPNTASVPVFFDEAWVDAWPKHTDTVPMTLSLDDPGGGKDWPVEEHIQRLILNRHFGSCNVSFVDTHAEGVDLSKLWSLKWHRRFIIYTDDKLRTDNKTPIYP